MESSRKFHRRESFDIELYFQYIKLVDTTSLNVSIESLKKVISHHNENFSYHNTLLYTAGKLPVSERKVPSLEKHNLLNDMIKNRGGYCFQQLELLHAVLSHLGFKVERYTAKIILKPYSKDNVIDNSEIKTHELLMIHLNDKRYIIDSGMCNFSLREPLEFKEGVQAAIDNDQYRLTKEANNRWRLDTKSNSKDKWFSMYAFYDKSVTYEEIVKHHTDLYLTKDQRFIRDNTYLAGVTTASKRKYIRWLFNQSPNESGFYSSVKSDGKEKTKTLSSLDEAIELSRDKFGLN